MLVQKSVNDLNKFILIYFRFIDLKTLLVTEIASHKIHLGGNNFFMGKGIPFDLFCLVVNLINMIIGIFVLVKSNSFRVLNEIGCKKDINANENVTTNFLLLFQENVMKRHCLTSTLWI